MRRLCIGPRSPAKSSGKGRTPHHLNQTHRRWFHPSTKSQIDFDPYQTLGVSKSADARDIKKAYHGLVKKFHPDVNKEPGAEKKFHKIQELYELLNDKQKRAQYDQFGAAAFDANGNTNPYAGGSNPFGGGSGGNPFGAGSSFGGFGFEDIFKEAFQGARGGRGGSRGSGSFVTEHVGDNIEVLKTISFKEAMFGTKVTINYKAIATCGTCHGLGLKANAKKKTCSTCHGTGQATHILGGFQMLSTCPSCNGTGVTINKGDECRNCGGQGVEEAPQSTTVELPCGINDGSRLRVPGAGDAPMAQKDAYNHTRNGDLIVRINIAKDPKFSRKGDSSTIVVDEEILMTTAALGGEITVPTIDGEKIKLKLRPGAQNGHTLTIPGKGVPINRNKNNRGNMEVVLKVRTLVPETPIQSALLEALADAFNDKNAKRTDAHWKLDLEDELGNAASETYDEKDLNPSKLRRIGKFLNRFFHSGENANNEDPRKEK